MYLKFLAYNVLLLTQYLLSFLHSQVYHIIRPSRAPGFAYSWLELISHRVFIAKLLLQTPQQKVCSLEY